MANATIKPDAFLTELSEIAQQLEASKALDREAIMFGKQLAGIAARIRENYDALVAASENLPDDVPVPDLDYLADSLTALNTVLVPQSTTQWEANKVAAKVTMLESMAELDMLTPEQAQELEALRPLLAQSRSIGNGIRKQRETLPSIEGRPAKVVASVGDWTSKQRGDTKQAPSNVKSAILKQGKAALKADVTTEDAAAVEVAVTTVCEGKAPSATANTAFGTVTVKVTD